MKFNLREKRRGEIDLFIHSSFCFIDICAQKVFLEMFYILSEPFVSFHCIFYAFNDRQVERDRERGESNRSEDHSLRIQRLKQSTRCSALFSSASVSLVLVFFCAFLIPSKTQQKNQSDKVAR